MSVWHSPLGKINRGTLSEDASLEYRETCLNQRLIDKYYEQRHYLIKRQAAELQRLDSQEYGVRLARFTDAT